MNSKNQNSANPLLTAVIGGMVSALVIYLLDDKRRNNIKDKYQELVEVGQDNKAQFQSKFDKSLKNGRKNLAKKIRRVEKRVAKS